MLSSAHFGMDINKKHRQPDIVCLIDGAKVGFFFEMVHLPYVNPMKKVPQKNCDTSIFLCFNTNFSVFIAWLELYDTTC